MGNGRSFRRRSLPTPAPQSDPRIVYGARCAWWSSIADIATTDSGLPICPHCGSPLFEVESEAAWWAGVDAHERNDNPGYRDFITWLRGKHFASLARAGPSRVRAGVRVSYLGASFEEHTEEAAPTEMILLSVDGDGEWTYIVREHVDEHDGDDEDNQFVVHAPARLVAELAAAERAVDVARAAIFDAVGWDTRELAFTDVCEAWVGDESPPGAPYWDVMYRASGSPDEWPADGQPARITSFDSAEEAAKLIASLPEQFTIHHHGLRLQLLDRSRLDIDGPHRWGPYVTGCFRCGHRRDDHQSNDG